MEFGVIQIVGGVIMLICSVLIIVLTLLQEQKQQDMSAALSGQSDNFYSKGDVSSTKEQAYVRLTRLLAVVFFVATVAVNIIPAIILKIKK